MWQLWGQESLWLEPLGWPLQAVLRWSSQKSSGLGWLLRCFLLGSNPHLRALTAHVELRTGYFQPALRCAKGSLLLNFVQGGDIIEDASHHRLPVTHGDNKKRLKPNVRPPFGWCQDELTWHSPATPKLYPHQPHIHIGLMNQRQRLNILNLLWSG